LPLRLVKRHKGISKTFYDNFYKHTYWPFPPEYM
jgi:hypothetical protein